MKTASPTLRAMWIAALVTILLFTISGLWAIAPKMDPVSPTDNPLSPTLPLAFIPNEGQLASDIRLQVNGQGGTLSFLQNEVRFDLSSDTRIRLEWQGAGENPAVAGANRLPGVANIMRGNDPAQWHTDIPMYGSADYTELYPGINLRYDGQDGRLKGTYTVAAGVNPYQIRWRFAGAESLAIDEATGDLQVALKQGQRMTEMAPLSWQMIDGVQVMVPTQYQLDGDTVSFAFPEGYSDAHELIIDPTLLYSSYIGGNSSDKTTGIALDRNGNIYMTGDTYSTDFLGQSEPTFGSADIFVAKLNPAGTQLLYLSIIGTDDIEYARTIEVDGQGNAVVSLDSFTTQFPTFNPYWSFREYEDDTAILFKLNGSGDFIFSTYVPLRTLETTHNLALDPTGNIHVVGTISGVEDPQGNWLGDQVGFVKLSPNGQELILTGHIGADQRWSHERGVTMTVDNAGTMYFAGVQVDGDADYAFSSPNAHQPICADVAAGMSYCAHEAFITVMDTQGNLTYTSYHGGSGHDYVTAIDTDGQGNVLLIGETTSPDFPTVNALQPTCPVSGDYCIQARSYVSMIKIQPTQSTMTYSTYWGANDRESSTKITAGTLDGGGNVVVTGWTDGTELPLRDPIQSNINPSICNVGGSERYCYDAFVSKFTSAGQLAFSTYFGANLDDLAYDLALDNSNNVFFVGETEAANFPAVGNPIQPNNMPDDDGFLVKIGLGGTVPPTSTPTVSPGTPTPTRTPGPPPPGAKKNFLPLIGGNP